MSSIDVNTYNINIIYYYIAMLMAIKAQFSNQYKNNGLWISIVFIKVIVYIKWYQ